MKVTINLLYLTKQTGSFIEIVSTTTGIKLIKSFFQLHAQ